MLIAHNQDEQSWIFDEILSSDLDSIFLVSFDKKKWGRTFRDFD